MNIIKIAVRFLRFYWKAKTKYAVHSPFVFEFVNNVLEDTRIFYVFDEAEALRNQLINSTQYIEVEDFGAGSKALNKATRRRLSHIAATALSPEWQCRWLFRMGQMFRPKTVLELGTSLGISTLYITEGVPREAQILTLEGAPAIARLARQHFDIFYDNYKKAGLALNDPNVLDFEHYALKINADFEKNKIKIIEGRFEQTLPLALATLGRLDFAFIDGNHRYEPTIQYFNQCLEYTHEGSVLIFDDIHWSAEMERAWHDIKEHPSVTLTLDLFWCGIIFFKKENQQKEHFSLIKAAWKPFNWGFF